MWSEFSSTSPSHPTTFRNLPSTKTISLLKRYNGVFFPSLSRCHQLSGLEGNKCDHFVTHNPFPRFCHCAATYRGLQHRMFIGIGLNGDALIKDRASQSYVPPRMMIASPWAWAMAASSVVGVLSLPPDCAESPSGATKYTLPGPVGTAYVWRMGPYGPPDGCAVARLKPANIKKNRLLMYKHSFHELLLTLEITAIAFSASPIYSLFK